VNYVLDAGPMIAFESGDRNIRWAAIRIDGYSGRVCRRIDP